MERARRTAGVVQQEIAGNSGVSSHLIWDLYTSRQKHVVLQKLTLLLPDIPENGDDIDNNSELTEMQKYKARNERIKKIRNQNEKMKEAREVILEAIWEQRKYFNGDLIMAIVYVLVTPDITDSTDFNQAQFATEYSCHTVFRIRKCRKTDSSSKCCMIFVDENGRVYQNWMDYIANNTLPAGIMVAPAEGVYTFDNKNKVILCFNKTPAAQLENIALQYTDTGAGILGISSSLIPIASFFIPVAAPVLLASSAIAAGVGMWSLGRSASQLVDRSNHEQSISLLDRQARSSWLGIAGGALGLGAGGLSQGLVRYVARGNDVSRIAQLAVNGINIAALTANGISVGNAVVEIIWKVTDDEEVSALDLLQLGASLVLFTHSVYNFQYASKIIETTRNGRISQFREELSIRQRKMFDKMVRETIRIKGDQQGRVDIIRSLRNIPDNKYFNDLYKIRKQMNEKGIRPSFNRDGNVLLNNEAPISSGELRQILQHNIGTLPEVGILKDVGPIPSTVKGGNSSTYTFNINYAIGITDAVIKGLKNFNVLNKTDLVNCLLNMMEKMAKTAIAALIDVTKYFVHKYVDRIQETIGSLLPFEQILWEAFEIVTKMNLSRQLITEEFIKEKSKVIIERLKDTYLNYINTSRLSKIRCPVCNGYYSIAQI